MTPRIILLVAAGVVLLLGGGAAVYAASSDVEVVVDDEVLTTRTFADEVGAVLDDLEIEVRAADEVVPPPDTPVEDGLTIEVLRATTVEVQIDDHPPREVTAVVDTVADVLREADQEDLLDREARIHPDPDASVDDSDRIVIELPLDVTIAVDDDVLDVETHASTVAGALEDADVTTGDRDLVDPALDTELEPATHITVQRVEVIEEEVEVEIDHAEERRETDEVPAGESRVETEGEEGLRIETYEVTLVDGEETERELVDEEIVREPTDAVVLVGVDDTPPPEEETPPPENDTPPPEDDAPPPEDDAPVIHLTFDDGPNTTYTPQVLDLLARFDAQATFFVVGQEVADHPEVTRRIADEGHTIGNHTWSHARLEGISRDRFDAEVGRTQDQIVGVAGVEPACLRPPYGATDEDTANRAAAHGLNLQMWDIDPRDWERPGTDAIVDDVLTEAEPGAVVLLHDGFRDREQTVAALERILAELSDRGYRFTAAPAC